MTNQKKTYWILVQPLLFTFLLWLIFALDQMLSLNLYRFSLDPRNLDAIWGIFTFPLIHGSLEHIAGNSWSIFVLLLGVRYFFPSLFGRVFIFSYLIPGVLTWFIGRDSYHLGASGMVYSLVGFLFFSGVIRLNRYLLALSMLVVFLYGNLFWYMFPIEDGISWEGHLSGAITGFILAIIYRKAEPTELIKEKEYFLDEEENEEEFWQSDQNSNEPQNDNSSIKITYHYKENKDEK